ncbi:hypothetical protein PRIPAC_79897 [Pristionchus pacificus]|uniref:RL10P_insert domain-containing protein n=1 Tax=Pristionchus pacificus TaxID=54126 RepID=A0A2A6CPB9_PRIPA|nr:hypothetical protein PRIPAC_79897 [Pristionchus pacificus]|eukprot:PDM79871.1 hypothetical protein PRIPAC_32450 [Pristionchus pacificus]
MRYELKDADFARAGVIAPQTIDLSALRKLGTPTSLVKGVIHLTQDFGVCTEGETIKPEEAKILKFLEEKLSVFQVIVSITPGTHNTEDAMNRQLRDKERVAAAMENSNLIYAVNKSLTPRV